MSYIRGFAMQDIAQSENGMELAIKIQKHITQYFKYISITLSS